MFPGTNDFILLANNLKTVLHLIVLPSTFTSKVLFRPKDRPSLFPALLIGFTEPEIESQTRYLPFLSFIACLLSSLINWGALVNLSKKASSNKLLSNLDQIVKKLGYRVDYKLVPSLVWYPYWQFTIKDNDKNTKRKAWVDGVYGLYSTSNPLEDD